MNLDINRICPEEDRIPEEYRIRKLKNNPPYLINGCLETYKGEERTVFSPLCCKKNGKNEHFKLGSYALLDEKKAMRALSAAEKAWDSGMGKWPQMSAMDRIEYLWDFVRRMRKREDEFVLWEMWEIAKSRSACIDEFIRTVKYIEDTIKKLHDVDQEACNIWKIKNFIAQVRHCPLGITLCMGPFNYPLNETFAMLIPALIMGNPVVVKLPRYGALCTIPLLEDFADVFPPGVVNIISGDGPTIITPVVKSGKISTLAFIGASGTAQTIINRHPFPNRLKTVLGLEAKNAAFVFPDCDLDLTVEECLKGALDFNGQRCTAIKHIWVHEDICEVFINKLNRRIEELKYGLPWEEGVVVTPLAEEGKCEYLGKLVEDAVTKGAHIVNSGGGENAGNLFYPAVLYPVTQDMEIFQVEQFGPIIPVASFSELQDLQDYLGECDYGQQASIFSSSPELAAPLIDILVNQVSRINLNSQCRRGPDELPFTGRKDSAEGTLSISEALKTFSLQSLVVANEAGDELFRDIIDSGKSRFLRA